METFLGTLIRFSIHSSAFNFISFSPITYKGIIVMDYALECMRGFAACLNGAKEKGVIYGKGMYEMNEGKGTKFMKQAYEIGKNI